MAELMRLQPCPLCGKEPEWYSAWADNSIATVSLWLCCNCRQIETKKAVKKLVGVKGDFIIKREMQKMAAEWDSYCEKAKSAGKENNNE